MKTIALPDALHARLGIICCVGAGGKKTTLYRLAAALKGHIGITTTTQMEYFPPDLTPTIVIAPQPSLRERIEASAGGGLIAYAQPATKPGRYAGIDPERVADIHAYCGFDVTLVKADGARGRLVKAPNTQEPPLPTGTATVVPLLSIRALGQPLTERIAHRLEQITAVSGAQPDEPLTVPHLARLLTSPAGALKDCGTATVVPVINMVESAAERQSARTLAEHALTLTTRFDRIVLTAMHAVNPVVDIIERV